MRTEHGQLDTTIEIVTPENIAFQYRLAGPFRRLLAWVIDLVIRFFFVAAMFFLMVLSTAFLGVPGVGVAVWLVTVFVVQWLYGALFEAFWNGQTIGKRVAGIRVLSKDGQPISGFQAVLRNVLRVADAQPFLLYLVGLCAATMNRRFQRLGDLAARTIVVVEETSRLRGVVPVVEPEAIHLAGLIPADFRASHTLARALVAYVERRQQFAWNRRMEIARHLRARCKSSFTSHQTPAPICCFALSISEHSSPIEATLLGRRVDPRFSNPDPLRVPPSRTPPSTTGTVRHQSSTSRSTDGDSESARDEEPAP